MNCDVVLVADDSPAGRASRAAFAAIVRMPLVRWPVDGLRPGDWGPFHEASEFWIGPGAHRCVMTRIVDTVSLRVTEPSVRSGWGWYVSRMYPAATVRFVTSGRITDALSAPARRADAVAFPLRLALLARAFHDMKGLHSNGACKGAAAWLASLGMVELWPFDVLRQQRLWDDWDRLPGAFREKRAMLVCDPTAQPERFAEVISKSARGFFQEVCCKYLGWATGRMKEDERARLLELSVAWR